MKNPLGSLIIVMLILFTSCGNRSNSSGVKFAPSAKSEQMSEAEKQMAITQKRQEYAPLSIDSILYCNGIKISVLPAKPDGVISQQMSSLLGNKAVQILAQNGVTGIGGDPIFFMAIPISLVNQKTTSTVPQTVVCQYSAMLYIGNMVTEDIYGAYPLTITGAGENIQEAGNNAVSSIENTPDIQMFISNCCEKIIYWYENHIVDIQRTVNQYVSKGRYDLAYAVIHSIPYQAKNCYIYAESVESDLFEASERMQAVSYMASMKDAIASSNSEYNPDVTKFFQMIPTSSSQWEEASVCYQHYLKSVEVKSQKILNHQLLLEETEAECQRLRIESEIRSSEALMMQYQQQEQSGRVGDSEVNVFDAESMNENGGTGLFNAILSNVSQLAVPHILQYIFPI